MKTVLFALAFLALTPPARAACEADPARLGAVYRIETRDDNGSRTDEMILWRNGSRAGHEFTSARIFELWEETPDRRVRLARYFDEFERGIEYEPREVGAEPGDDMWQRKRQLLPNRALTDDRRQAIEGEGCDLLKRYAWEEEGRRFGATWMPERNLVDEYRVASEHGTVEWKLLRVIDRAAEVDAAFARRDAYRTTDHVDIGDHESDPVLLEIIRRGYVDHPHGDHPPSP